MAASETPENERVTAIREEIREGYRNLTREEPARELSRDAMHLARNMILTHRMGNPIPFVRQLVEPTASVVLQAGPSHPRRASIGTDDSVFLWWGPSAYTAPPFVIFLDPLALEEEAGTGGVGTSVRVAPWDTLGLVGHGVLGFNCPEETAANLVAWYSVGFPVAHEVLAEVLEHCFAAPSSYVKGNEARACYPGRHGRPLRSREERLPAQTFEVRKPREVRVDGAILAIVTHREVFGLEQDLLSELTVWGRRQEPRVLVDVIEPGVSVRARIVERAEALLSERDAL